MELTTAIERPLRADARRNRERVLNAASEVFAEQGREAPMDEIARQAGVGVGTVYRHFPDKEALMEALLEARFGEFARLGQQALEHEDPWQGFSDWLFACGEAQAADMGLCDGVADVAGNERPADVAERTGLNRVTAEVIERCQAAGVIRADALPADVPVLMTGLSTSARARDAVGVSWRRHLTILLDGLRAPGSSPLPD